MEKYFWGAEILGGFSVLIWTFSRSAWLGASLIFLLFAIQAWQKNLAPKLKKRLFLGGIMTILGLGILFFGTQNWNEIFLRFGSTSQHFEKSQAALELLWQNPLGLGLGSTGGVSQRFGDEITPENTFLGVSLELGWLGGILFLLFCLTLLGELQKSNSELFYAWLGILAIMFFLHPLEDSPTALSLFLLAGITIRSKSPNR